MKSKIATEYAWPTLLPQVFLRRREPTGLFVAEGARSRKRLLLVQLEWRVRDRLLEVGIGGKDDVFIKGIHAAAMAKVTRPEGLKGAELTSAIVGVGKGRGVVSKVAIPFLPR